MSEIFRFKCLRCGYCCSHLLTETVLGKLGLFLFPSELHFFPKDKIRPLYGAGSKGKSRPRPEVVYAYQLETERCPWLDRNTNQCQIYKRRPQICRAFPFNGTVADFKCRAISSCHLADQELRVAEETVKEEIQADFRIRQEIFAALSKSDVFWVWPLNERIWKANRREKLSRYAESLNLNAALS